MDAYKPRILDSILKNELEAFGAVSIVGAKWCGKTTTAREQAKSVLYMQDPDRQTSYLQLAQIQPSTLLEGENPRLIDEWQLAPPLWDAVRHSVDMRGESGLYILTGSTSVDESKIQHSGAGRISRLKMYPMSLYESLDSTGSVHLEDLFNKGGEIEGYSDLSIENYAELIVRGGWPGAVGKPAHVVFRLISGYCDSLIQSDIKAVDGVSRDEVKVTGVLKAIARNVGTAVSNATLIKDMNANGLEIHPNTFDSYTNALRKLFILDELSAWSPRLRSKSIIRTSKTKYFADPAIAAHFLQAGAKDILFDFRSFGLLFENLAVRDLRIYMQKLGGQVANYRDSSGLEVDMILHRNDGQWAAVEIKLGENSVEKAAQNLLKFKSQIDEEEMRSPAFLMVITGSQYAYRRPDGVYVVPLGCLAP